MTTWAYWSLQTTCTYGDFVRFFKLNDNSGFSTCFFFQIIIFEIFIKILPKLSWHMVFLMKYLWLLNRIIRWQNDSVSRLLCTMVISNAFFLHFPSWQKGQKKKCSWANSLGAFWAQKHAHFIEGIFHFDKTKNIKVVNLNFKKHQKNSILQGKC